MTEIYEHSKNFRDLVVDVKRSPLVLFVGAGINDKIVPSWSELLNELLEILASRISAITSGDSSLHQELIDALQKGTEYERATLAKSILGNEYPVHLRSIIYKNYKESKLRNALSENKGFLSALVQLSASKKVKAIVSYNYDNILQTAINLAKKRKAVNICGSMTNAILPSNALPIYYVHGYIPNKVSRTSEDSKVVLSLDEYFRIMMEPYSWQTTTQIHFLQNYVSLFLGTSLKDWNMLRMLNIAKKYSVLGSVYCVMRRKKYVKKEGKINKTGQYVLNQVNATLLHDNGVKVINSMDTTYPSIHQVVRNLSDTIE